MKFFSTAILAFIAIIFSKFNSVAQQNKQSGNVEVIQFHSDHRCMTCLKIEKLTKATLAAYFADVPFVLVNVDDKKNAQKAEAFEATGTALYLYNPKTRKKKDLTDFAFMKASDEKKFEAELKKHIEDFIKS